MRETKMIEIELDYKCDAKSELVGTLPADADFSIEDEVLTIKCKMKGSLGEASPYIETVKLFFIRKGGVYSESEDIKLGITIFDGDSRLARKQGEVLSTLVSSYTKFVTL